MARLSLVIVPQPSSAEESTINGLAAAPSDRLPVQMGSMMPPLFRSCHYYAYLNYASPSVITLKLLHPLQSTPIQVWSFDQESVIRIGRSTDNQVVLYSAVVSRNHVELRYTNRQWELVNLGSNGTYIDGQRVSQVPVTDGMVIRLARSGPHIQIHLDTTPPGGRLTKASVAATSGTPKATTPLLGTGISGDDVDQTRPGPTHLPPTEMPPDPFAHAPPTPLQLNLAEGAEGGVTQTLRPPPIAAQRGGTISRVTSPPLCTHERATPDRLFCLDCGQPLRVLQTVGNYQIIRIISQDNVGITYQGWRNGQSYVIKTLNSNYWLRHPEVMAGFEKEAKRRRQLRHPGLPRFVDLFPVAGQPYLVNEMIYGLNLAEWIQQYGAVPQSQAIAWILQVCDILDYMHSHSPPILHGDVKPKNLIRRAVPKQDYEIALVDFGIIQNLVPARDTWFTPKGFMAPEQRAGKAVIQSDLYSLGYTLTYLLTGSKPLPLYEYEETGWQFTTGAVAGVSPAIAQVIQQVTHPQPDRRFPSARALAAKLRQFL